MTIIARGEESLHNFLIAHKDLVTEENPYSGGSGDGRDDDLCKICLCEVEEPSFTSSLCGHRSCKECMQGMVMGAENRTEVILLYLNAKINTTSDPNTTTDTSTPLTMISTLTLTLALTLSLPLTLTLPLTLPLTLSLTLPLTLSLTLSLTLPLTLSPMFREMSYVYISRTNQHLHYHYHYH